jgi:DNA polymerase III epsilon subunit-like protein
MKILVFDTETTGLPKTKEININNLDLWPHIVQFSYIVYDMESNKIDKMGDFIIKVPFDVTISDESIRIHGITNKKSQDDGVPLSHVYSIFFEDIRSVDTIVGHNINFDLNMLKVELIRSIKETKHIGISNYTCISLSSYDDLLNIEKIQLKNMLYVISYGINVRCTMLEGINLCNIKCVNKKGGNYMKYPTLLELYKKLFNDTPKNLHNSFVDILITLICFMKMNNNIEILNVSNDVQKLVEEYNIL